MAVGNTFGATALASYGGFWIGTAIILTPGGFEIESTLEATGGAAEFLNSFGLYLFVSMTIRLTRTSLLTRDRGGSFSPFYSSSAPCAQLSPSSCFSSLSTWLSSCSVSATLLEPPQVPPTPLASRQVVSLESSRRSSLGTTPSPVSRTAATLSSSSLLLTSPGLTRVARSVRRWTTAKLVLSRATPRSK